MYPLDCVVVDLTLHAFLGSHEEGVEVLRLTSLWFVWMLCDQPSVALCIGNGIVVIC